MLLHTEYSGSEGLVFYLFAQASEGGAVGAFRLVQSPQNTTNTGALQLLEDGVQIAGLKCA